MKKLLKVILVLAIIGVLYYALLGSFRYKNYSSSDYVFILKDKGKTYKMDEISIAGDRITGKKYVMLGLSKNRGKVVYFIKE